MQGGGFKFQRRAFRRRYKNGKLLPKEVKNGHIAESKNPVEPKERDYKALCDFNEFFHWSRLLC